MVQNFEWCKFSYISNGHSVFENKLRKYERHAQLHRVQFEVLAISPLQKLRSGVSFPIPCNGSLSASVSPATIKEANKAVKSVTSEGKSKRRGSCAMFSPEQQAAICKYASLHARQIFSSARGILANGRVPIGRPLAIERTRACSRSCKTTKIYSQGILVNYTKICTNENFPLFSRY